MATGKYGEACQSRRPLPQKLRVDGKERVFWFYDSNVAVALQDMFDLQLVDIVTDGNRRAVNRRKEIHFSWMSS